jgi:hypothetical protein
MLRPTLWPWAGALILASAVAGSAAVLAARLGGGEEGPGTAGEPRMRALEALLQATGYASALCTSAPSKPSDQVNR